MIVWQEFLALAADNRALNVRLNANSLTFFMCAADLARGRRSWQQDDLQPVTDAQWDDIDELIGEAFTEIMTSILTGTIFPFVTSAVPEGALECDGTTYLRTDYPDLYAVLDPAFIVDADHFTVPDLRSRVAMGAGTGGGFSTYLVGATGGEEKHHLLVAEMPSHSHNVTDAGHVHSDGIAAPNVTTIGPGAPEPTAIPAPGVTGVGFTGISIQTSGDDIPHENRPPYLAVRFAIWQ